MKSKLKVGDRVVFSKAVIQRTQHSEFTTTFVGTVVNMFGATCDVDTGYGTRCIPVANLVKIKNSIVMGA